MKIRKATKKDLKAFLALQKEAFPNLDLKKQTKYFNLKLGDNEIFCIIDNNEYVGHLCFGKHLINPPLAKSIFIEELAVKNEFKGKGFGKLLVEYVISYCKKNKVNIIYTSTGDYDNNDAKIFYTKLGFKKVGSLKDIDPCSEYNYGQIFFAKVVG